MENELTKTPKVTFHISDPEWTNLKLISMLTHTTMSHFIRTAIKEKIKNLKAKNKSLEDRL